MKHIKKCIVIPGIKHWSPSYADLRINLIPFRHPVVVILAAGKCNWRINPQSVFIGYRNQAFKMEDIPHIISTSQAMQKWILIKRNKFLCLFWTLSQRGLCKPPLLQICIFKNKQEITMNYLIRVTHIVDKINQSIYDCV